MNTELIYHLNATLHTAVVFKYRILHRVCNSTLVHSAHYADIKVRKAIFQSIANVTNQCQVHTIHSSWYTYTVFQKVVHQLISITLSILNRFLIFFALALSGKFAIKLSLKIPTHSKRVTTLPCEILEIKSVSNSQHHKWFSLKLDAKVDTRRYVLLSIIK